MIARRILIACLLVAVAAPATADDVDFSLDLESIDLTPVDPRTEARIAQWESEMGRVMHHMQHEQAIMMRGGMAPGGSGGAAVRMRLQPHLDAVLVAASVEGGIDIYDRAIEVIRWPWRDPGRPVLPMEQQLSLLLGKRLEAAATAAASVDGGTRDASDPTVDP